MRALVLNLANATDRLSFMTSQLDALGLPWDRIKAVTPATLTPPADDPVWHHWERPLRKTEMAACASHIAAWRLIVDVDEPCLVLEDDALLDRGIPALLAALASTSDIDHVSLETRGRRKFLATSPHTVLPIRRMYLDRTGAAAYVLWPTGARKLLSRAQKARGLADGMICAASELISWQADPALAIQADRAAAHGWEPPIPITSQIGAEQKPPKGALPFRIRRLRAQAVQGLHQLRFVGTERREVEPKGDWVTPLSVRADTTQAR